jgi:hypothetical protein
MNREQLFTPWNEFRRYGYIKKDWKWVLLWLPCSIVLAIVVPNGQGENLFQYFMFYLAMAGFGGTVFGFTILGGKDDFFEPIIEEKKEGINALRDMVLFLFVPLVLHGGACILLIMRILFPFLTQTECLQFLFRCVYGFIAMWAIAQTYFSYRFLFTLAITRLVWKYSQIYHPKDPQGNNYKDHKLGDV